MHKKNNILIVGAASSIGGAIVSRFCSPDTNIIVSCFPKNAFKPAGNLRAVGLDLRNDKSIKDFVAEVRSAASHISTAIFLAGVLPGKNLKEYKSADIDKVMGINFTGQAKVIKGLLPLFDSDSQIILISSISAQRGSYDPIYAASKGAILSFVKALAIGLGGVRVNAIAPGLIEGSAMYKEMSAGRQELHRQQTSGKKLLDISDLAGIIYDISQSHWKHLNGACIDINGGQYTR